MALLGWALMTLGAFVRASESGLGCPDWPACHGQLVAGGHHAMIEEFHRWVATMLVVGVVALALMVFRGYRHERRVTRPMVWVLALLALQVVLGGVTVLLRNASWTVVFTTAGQLSWWRRSRSSPYDSSSRPLNRHRTTRSHD
jgi:heme A synthase